jgi:dienelactone hydrolase
MPSHRSIWSLVAYLVVVSPVCLAAEPRFKRHPVDPQSGLAAAAAFDVNRDGKLDIVTGAAWYEAPSWKKHVVRDVEFIRGRYDDYSCLPLDVNGDGWTDFVTANYRSEKLAWIEHPGEKPGTWKEHIIEKPGPMETGRLYDVNGDGRPDILPNGRDFAAWWELTPPSASAGSAEVRWRRHDLPPQVIGHGVGFGDINGDGRGDVIGPGGWLEASEDRRQGAWRWHGEFNLGRDASIPILVLDVDGDGDNDIAWGRGHSVGVCWLEQQQSQDRRTRLWKHHVIDTSWTQPHTIEAADVDNDGRLELVAGKRYLGHDGKDLGEWDPLVIYWYKFDPATHAWRRGTISAGGPAAFDLDNKLLDLDGDGDLDLVAAGRSGLYWFENLLKSASPGDAASHPAPEPPQYTDHTRLLVYIDELGRTQPVKTPADWARRRAHVLQAFQSIVGELPDSSRRVPLDVQQVEKADAGKYTRIKLTYQAEPGDRVPAYLLLPTDLKKSAPAMLCLHQTTELGKDEPAGLGGSSNLRYAHELAERGYVCLVPDYPSLGEYKYNFAAKGTLPSGTMKAIWNNIRGIDLLETLPEVDVRRIGVIGHSLGGHNAIFTALFDLRLRAIVSSCGFTAFSDDDLASWSAPRYMPRLRNVIAGPQQPLPFEFHELIAALAPRPFFANSPQRDDDFSVAGVRKVMASAGDVYQLLDAKDRLQAVYPDAGHDFPVEQREEAYRCLERVLK